MGLKLNGLSRANREYVAAHPGCTGRELVTHNMATLGVSNSRAWHDASKQVRRGLLRVEMVDGVGRYFIGRPAAKCGPGNALPEDERRRRRLRSANSSRTARRSSGRSAKEQPSVIRHYPTQVVDSTPAETVEEWMARGGHIDVLQGYTYVLPERMPVGVKAYA